MTDRADESIAAWGHLVDALAAAGRSVGGVGDEVDVAEGFRYVLNVLGDQLDRETLRDSTQPLFLPGITPVRKLFFDNPDADYDTALVTGNRTYRITGTRGTATYLAFCAYSGGPDETRVANLADADMAFEADGSFEVTLSPTEPPANGSNGGNWIRLDPDTHTVIARQYFLDRATERPARYRIEAVGDDPPDRPDPPLDAARFARLARRTARFVTGAAELARRRAEQASGWPNRFIEVPGHGVYGTPDAGYMACWYELGPGEALVVQVRPPRCRYWGVHLANLWGQSLDHRTRSTALNARTATTDAGGSVRIVVAPTDAGEADWLDTAGHPRGWVLFRWLLADEAVVPDARVVTLQRERDGGVRPA
jgi:hypothetical protein